MENQLSKYDELALIIGENPREIEENWSIEDVQKMLLVHSAQQRAKIEIARRDNIKVSEVVLINAVTVETDSPIIEPSSIM